jgi:tryptophan-rich sensory protein
VSLKPEPGEWKNLAAAIAIPQVSGGIGAIAVASSVKSWYRTIKKPSWNPPNWLFGPVWTVLYLLMGVASWLVWREREGNPEARGALNLYWAQLGLNALWTPLFFGFHRIGLAAAEIAVLWAAILATIARFYRIRPAAGLLLVPYQLWTTFAGVLNATVWRLNR